MSDARNGPGEPKTNLELQAMHRELIALGQRLERSIDDAPTAAAISAIADQMVEVNARVNATGRVLLARQTEEITEFARAVSAALPQIEDEIADLLRHEQLVRSLASMLSVVDEAVRVATLVCR